MYLYILFRYIEVLRLGYISRKTKQKDDLDSALRANVDVSLLRLIEAFTESAPQLVLQLYIMLKFSHYNWLIGKQLYKSHFVFLCLRKRKFIKCLFLVMEYVASVVNKWIQVQHTIQFAKSHTKNYTVNHNDHSKLHTQIHL